MKSLLARVSVAATTVIAVPACFGHEGPRQYPEWNVSSVATPVGCANMTTWVAKSGKEGVLVTVHLQGTQPQACQVELTGLTLALADRHYGATKLPAPPTLGAGTEVFLYVPIHFDADAAWNDDAQREGNLIVGVRGHADVTLPVKVSLRDNRDCIDEVAPVPPPPPPPPPAPVQP